MKAKYVGYVLAGILGLTAVGAAAEQVIIIAKPPGLPMASCPAFCETSPAATWSSTGSSAHSSAFGDNAGGSVFAPGTVVGIPQCTVTPTLLYSNAVYDVEVTHVSLNASTNILISLSATGGTLSSNQTDGFQAAHAINSWYHIAYLTNTTSTPTITFTYASGDLAAFGGRWYVDGFRFTTTGPSCEQVPRLTSIDDPLAPGQTFVSAPNLKINATNVTVYADNGVGTSLVQIGSLAVTNATNAIVPVAPLTNGNYISATQWIGGMESCQFFAGSGKLVSFNTVSPAPINITYDGTNVVLNWPGLHVLQSSAEASSGFTDLPGPILRGPYTNAPAGGLIYYRLKN